MIFDLVNDFAAVLDAMPEGRIQFVQHHTPEFVWRPAFLGHTNNVVKLACVFAVADDPVAALRLREHALARRRAAVGRENACGDGRACERRSGRRSDAERTRGYHGDRTRRPLGRMYDEADVDWRNDREHGRYLEARDSRRRPVRLRSRRFARTSLD